MKYFSDYTELGVGPISVAYQTAKAKRRHNSVLFVRISERMHIRRQVPCVVVGIVSNFDIALTNLAAFFICDPEIMLRGVVYRLVSRIGVFNHKIAGNAHCHFELFVPCFTAGVAANVQQSVGHVRSCPRTRELV